MKLLSQSGECEEVRDWVCKVECLRLNVAETNREWGLFFPQKVRKRERYTILETVDSDFNVNVCCFKECHPYIELKYSHKILMNELELVSLFLLQRMPVWGLPFLCWCSLSVPWWCMEPLLWVLPCPLNISFFCDLDVVCDALDALFGHFIRCRLSLFLTPTVFCCMDSRIYQTLCPILS